MSNRLHMRGLPELMKALQQLPWDLRADAATVVEHRARLAFEEIDAGYPEGPTGKLKNGLSISISHGANTSPGTPGRGVEFGAKVILRNRAKHAWLFENGSQARHVDELPAGRARNLGSSRGAMPPGRVFIPIAIRHRHAMQRELIEIVRRAGFLVR